MNKSFAAAAGTLAALTAAGGLALAALAKEIYHRTDKAFDVEKHLSGDNAMMKRVAEGREELAKMTFEEVSILSEDGLKLAGRIYHPEAPSDHYMLCMHGFRSSGTDFLCAVPFFVSLGYHVLLADQRAHGESEGTWITFGVRERYDCLAWCRYLTGRFGDGISIVLDGLSMGAATVLMATGLPLPGAVKAVIADCGYTSPYEIAGAFLAQRVPRFAVRPVMTAFRPIVRAMAGFDLKEASTEQALAHSDLPVLLIHGTADELVPYEMSVTNKRACRGPAELISVEGARHGLSYIVDEPRCREGCRAFLDRYDPRSDVVS